MPSSLLPVSLLLIMLMFQLPVPSQAQTLCQLQQRPDNANKLRQIVSSWSYLTKQKHQVYAVKSGSAVRRSSNNHLNYDNFELDYVNSGYARSDAWCPFLAKVGQWIGVGKQIPSLWTDVIIQGRQDLPHWVKSVKIYFTLTGYNWEQVDGGKIFDANFDQNTKKRITFDKPVYARAIRIFPQTWYGFSCLRFDAIYIDFYAK